MQKGTWLIVTAVAALIGFGWLGLAGTVIALLVFAVPYAIVCRLAPRTRHTGFRACNGTGEARSKLFPWAYHRCQGCNGTGRQVRLGARYLGPDHVKTDYQSAQAARRQRRRDHTHR